MPNALEVARNTKAESLRVAKEKLEADMRKVERQKEEIGACMDRLSVLVRPFEKEEWVIKEYPLSYTNSRALGLKKGNHALQILVDYDAIYENGKGYGGHSIVLRIKWGKCQYSNGAISSSSVAGMIDASKIESEFNQKFGEWMAGYL
jgi:hypothetical protein